MRLSISSEELWRSRRVLSVSAITPSEISRILHMIRKPNSIIVLPFIQKNCQFKTINVKLIFYTACLSASLGNKRLFSCANIIQITDVIRRVVFLLFLLCYYDGWGFQNSHTFQISGFLLMSAFW